LINVREEEKDAREKQQTFALDIAFVGFIHEGEKVS
jgi:hypothetical protein